MGGQGRALVRRTICRTTGVVLGVRLQVRGRAARLRVRRGRAREVRRQRAGHAHGAQVGPRGEEEGAMLARTLHPHPGASCLWKLPSPEAVAPSHEPCIPMPPPTTAGPSPGTGRIKACDMCTGSAVNATVVRGNRRRTRIVAEVVVDEQGSRDTHGEARASASSSVNQY